AKELAERGQRLAAVRIDSGDLAEISKKARALLDAAGLREVKILASGDLDERRIAGLRAAGAPIDAYGVGTKLAACDGDPALSCVYKLVAVEDEAGSGRLEGRMKRTDDPAKGTLPGIKQVYRKLDGAGLAREDLLELAEVGGPPAPRSTRSRRNTGGSSPPRRIRSGAERSSRACGRGSRAAAGHMVSNSPS